MHIVMVNFNEDAVSIHTQKNSANASIFSMSVTHEI